MGRVQSPAVRLIVEREIEISNFKPSPYYVLTATIIKDDKTLESVYEKQKIEDKEEAQKIFDQIKDIKKSIIKDVQKKKSKEAQNLHLQPQPYNKLQTQF